MQAVPGLGPASAPRGCRQQQEGPDLAVWGLSNSACGGPRPTPTPGSWGHKGGQAPSSELGEVPADSFSGHQGPGSEASDRKGPLLLGPRRKAGGGTGCSGIQQPGWGARPPVHSRAGPAPTCPHPACPTQALATGLAGYQALQWPRSPGVSWTYGGRWSSWPGGKCP